ncbi:hypothetical protein BO78DRAFT_472329 [Aspergillus sclerotiicarbonarius CBS 121057]|uniref:Uncharacterized protein n=1 Tax=Aspergillus sclerotiicarbonarius (strain CBS 121057 / IBT 28362) TaxID=1448318 RepID=A0A319E032_ASPSB|nr:hypothetical protein BO78DRAFT_472329 [Aspergillus sclerotiicarbonarius CBS 121057]
MPLSCIFIRLHGRHKSPCSPCLTISSEPPSVSPSPPQRPLSPEPLRQDCCLLRLPDELLLWSARYLDQQSLSRFTQTCRFIHRLRADLEKQSHRAPAHAYAEWYEYRREVQKNDVKSVVKPSDPPEPLRDAVVEGKYRLVKSFLEDHVDPNSWNVYGSSMLFLAIQNRHYNITRLLLQFGADPNREGAFTVDHAMEGPLALKHRPDWFELLLFMERSSRKRAHLSGFGWRKGVTSCDKHPGM